VGIAGASGFTKIKKQKKRRGKMVRYKLLIISIHVGMLIGPVENRHHIGAL